MEQSKNYFPDGVFHAIKNYGQIINEKTPLTKSGKREYYLSKIRENTYQKTNSKEKVLEYVFALNNHNKEQVEFHLTSNGTLKSATYINWEDSKQPQKVFLAKDLGKLARVAKDPGLVGMAGQFDWSKVKPPMEKEVETKENEVNSEELEEAPIELD